MAWSLLFSFITEKLLEGYNLEKVEQDAVHKGEDAAGAKGDANQACCQCNGSISANIAPGNATSSECDPSKSPSDDAKCPHSNRGEDINSKANTSGKTDDCVTTEPVKDTSVKLCSTSTAGTYKHNTVPSITFSVADT